MPMRNFRRLVVSRHSATHDFVCRNNIRFGGSGLPVVGILKCDVGRVGQIIAGGPNQWLGLVGISCLSQETTVALKENSRS